MIEAAGHSSIPFPIFVGIFFVVMFVIGQLKPKRTESPASTKLRDDQRRFTPSTRTPGAPPPPIPNAARQKKAKRRSQPAASISDAAARAAQAAARAKADARTTASQTASDAQAPKMPAKPPTIASNARNYFQRGGLRDAFILSEILSRPMSDR